MISAVEARALYDRVGEESKKLLNDIDHRITKVAVSRCTTFFLLDCEETFRHVEPTPVQARVMEELKELGFSVTFGKDGEPYVPRGLSDDNGNGPKHINYGFHIKW